MINDHLGHNAGDRFIKAFTGLVGHAVEIPSIIARFGGDEFVVVPTGPMDVEDAEVFAQRVQKGVGQQVAIDVAMNTSSMAPPSSLEFAYSRIKDPRGRLRSAKHHAQ